MEELILYLFLGAISCFGIIYGIVAHTKSVKDAIKNGWVRRKDIKDTLNQFHGIDIKGYTQINLYLDGLYIEPWTNSTPFMKLPKTTFSTYSTYKDQDNPIQIFWYEEAIVIVRKKMIKVIRFDDTSTTFSAKRIWEEEDFNMSLRECLKLHNQLYYLYRLIKVEEVTDHKKIHVQHVKGDGTLDKRYTAQNKITLNGEEYTYEKRSYKTGIYSVSKEIYVHITSNAYDLSISTKDLSCVKSIFALYNAAHGSATLTVEMPEVTEDMTKLVKDDEIEYLKSQPKDKLDWVDAVQELISRRQEELENNVRLQGM